MSIRHFYWFLQVPATIAVILCVTTDIFARYHLPRIHDRLAVFTGFIGALAALLWQAALEVRRRGKQTPRRDLPSMF